MLVRSRNRVIRRPAANIVLTLSSDGDHLPALFAACATPEWMRSCAIAICDPSLSGPVGLSIKSLAGAHRSAVSDDQQAIRESISILLQRMSANPAYRSLFRVANLHSLLLDSAADAAGSFYAENIAALLRNLESWR